MGATENAELVRRGYEAFNAGDLAALSELFAEDAVWYAAGSGVLSGTKQGRDAVLAYFGELGARSQGSFQAAVQDIVGGENHTVGIQQSRAESNGKTLDVATAIAFVLRDGKVVEGREFFEDTAKGDEFWA
jgi:ketosteroid isomerase-like protein